jgi:hypothetical protein
MVESYDPKTQVVFVFMHWDGTAKCLKMRSNVTPEQAFEQYGILFD